MIQAYSTQTTRLLKPPTAAACPQATPSQEFQPMDKLQLSDSTPSRTDGSRVSFSMTREVLRGAAIGAAVAGISATAAFVGGPYGAAAAIAGLGIAPNLSSGKVPATISSAAVGLASIGGFFGPAGIAVSTGIGAIAAGAVAFAAAAASGGC